ncbi:MAG: M3 family oligoendopeptidase [Chloroflexi bacterium]|nr:M3 family oligoendopeptidase [Chloroflexota bacterium]
MFKDFPADARAALTWDWHQFQPYFDALREHDLSAATLQEWMHAWDRLQRLLHEVRERLYVATTLNTADEAAEKAFAAFYENIFPHSQVENQKLKQMLLASGLEPPGFAVQMRNLRAEAALYRDQNVPLLADEQKLSNEYDKIVGAMAVTWDGREVPLPRLLPVLEEQDRARRELAWRTYTGRYMQDAARLKDLWTRFMDLRARIAANAGLPSFREYRWQQMLRLDYTPEDCKRFHAAIEQVVVPAARALREKRRQKLGLETLRPWDTEVDLTGLPPLRPYQTADELNAKAAAIFHKVDSELGAQFDCMRAEDLLDLESRVGKAPGGYCTDFPLAGQPFIFMNAVGQHGDVQTLLHEAGHAFHAYAVYQLPYYPQLQISMEIAEVASMSMELLAAPYLAEFYTEAEAARARVQHLEDSLLFWPYMAVVDAFQHWVYENASLARDADRCDEAWNELWDRFVPGIDYSGLEKEKAARWLRQLHIHQVPFYYVDYGLAQLGAAQVWANAIENQAGATRQYRQALALGATRTLPELYAAAGIKLAFDADTLGRATDLIMSTIEKLEAVG